MMLAFRSGRLARGMALGCSCALAEGLRRQSVTMAAVNTSPPSPLSDSPKTIALLGATGFAGRHVLDTALARGHKVRTLVRDPKKLAPQEQLEVVKGDALNAEDVAAVVLGADVVVSCVGGKSRSDTIMTSLAKNLIPSVKDDQRLLMITSLGCGGTSPIVNLGMKLMFGFGLMRDMDQADAMVRGKIANAIVVRPPRLVEEPVTGKYFATTAHPYYTPLFCAMSYGDVAKFILDAVEDTSWDGKAVQLYDHTSHGI